MVGVKRIFRVLMPGLQLAEQASAQAVVALDLPAEIALGDLVLTVRYLDEGDGERILDFARNLSAHDMLFLRRDITRKDQVDVWLGEIQAGHTVTVAAFRGDELVGYASVSSEGLSWTRHVRELRVAVAASMRRLKLGQLLTQQAFVIAREQGCLKMIAQMTVDQAAAISVFKRMGFEPEALLRRQVMDRDGRLHDLQIMSLDVRAFDAKLMMFQTDAEFQIQRF